MLINWIGDVEKVVQSGYWCDMARDNRVIYVAVSNVQSIPAFSWVILGAFVL